MAIIDFLEIRQGNASDGLQDTFELFAREFLNSLGFKILLEPNRGADDGKDLIVEETRKGIAGTTLIKWLVSCKHFAHSGRSVTASDEINILERVKANGCKAFLGFYSTLPSSGFSNQLKGLNSELEITIYDREKIERYLLGSLSNSNIIQRFFPNSFSKLKRQTSAPAQIFETNPKLKCYSCGKNLIETENKGIIVVWEKVDANEIQHLYWCCKGECDDKLSNQYHSDGLVDLWEDIEDILIPVVYAKWMIAPLNRLRSGYKYSDEAFENFKEFMLCIFPYISRHPKDSEEEKVKKLMELPGILGGFA